MADTPGRSALLECRGLDTDVDTVVVTRGLDISLQPGQCWCILGRNGVGKTTLLTTLAGLHAPTAGEIDLRGAPLATYPRRRLARDIGILFQDHEDVFPATVLETVLQGRHPHLRAWQWESAGDLEIARRALQLVGVAHLENRNIQTLSGGERRRVGLAALVAQDTQLLLLDEPTNHLDLHHRMSTLQRLVEYCRAADKCVVMVLHDLNIAARFADHCLLLFGDGESRAGASADILETPLLERLYQHPLIAVDSPTGPAWLAG